MPYKNKNGYTRKNYYNRGKPQGPPRYKMTYGNVLDKVTSDIGRLKNLINVEFKAKDTADSFSISTTMQLTLLNGLKKGDDINTRDGRQVRFKSVWIKMCFAMSTAATDTFVRIILFIDKQPNSVTINPVDILQEQTVESGKQLDSRKRIVILVDRVIVLQQANRTSQFVNIYKNIDMKTVYDASDVGSIADISTNALFIALLSNELTNQPTVGRFMRVRFIDN